MTRHSHHSRAALGLIALGIAGCGSSPTRLYTPYSPGQQQLVANYTGPPMRVDSVHLPPSLDRLEIITDLARGEKKINELDHWSAPLGQLARQTLTEDLAVRLPPGTLIYPHLNKPAGALGIQVDILEFGVNERGARLMASYSVASSSGVAMRADAQLLDTAQTGTTPAATAQALSALLDKLAQHVAQKLTGGN